MKNAHLRELLPDRWTLLACVAIVAVFLGAGWLVRVRNTPVEVGFRAPDFTATDLQGRAVSLSGLEGEVVFLNIWATWCPPCREEMPSMQRLYDKLGPEGLRMVAISIDAPSASRDSGGQPGGSVGAFVEEYALTFDIWLDPEGDVQRVYQTLGVPESVIIGRDGLIAKKVIGSTNWDTEENIALIRRLLRART